MRFFLSLLFILISTACASSFAGPVFDPFLESFQVGTFSDPGKMEMAGPWPGGLMTPVAVDTAWCRTAYQFLNGEGDPGDLTHRLTGPLSTAGQKYLAAVRRHAGFLLDPEIGDWRLDAVPGPLLLREEAWAVAIFRTLDAGKPAEAARLVETGLAPGTLQLRERERFAWQLRLGYLKELAGEEALRLAAPWPADTALGPYDRGAVWNLWVAHRRALGLPVIPPHWGRFEEAAHLAGLAKPHFSAAELENSGFPAELKAGIGATLFEGQELADHLARYPDAPGPMTVQGWWVKGMRFLKRGQPEHYEQLARREDLRPGWKMDVLRRASEVRLLRGEWAQGLADLKLALDLAAQDAGTPSLRRLVRYWVEQASVLALQQERPDTAWQLIEWGDATFKGESLRVWQDETRHWRELKTGRTTPPVPGPAGAAATVASGQAPDLQIKSLASSRPFNREFLEAADRSLWDLWTRWGLALADTTPLSGTRKIRALDYSQMLRAPSAGEDLDPPEQAVLAIAQRFQGRSEILGPFLAKVIDRDLGRLTGWELPPRPSPVPGLLPTLRHSQLDMHAALGLALATGDMRGILAIAYELPGSGLTLQEKRRFLYPLPDEGPIRQGILAAESEPALILAVARNESLFEPAVRSRAGALGWMQIMPFHFPDRGAREGVDHWAIPAVSIRKGDLLLTENRRRFEGDPYLTLSAYNAGPEATGRWLKQLGGQAPRDIFLAWIGYTETRGYVEKVLIDREIYDWILTDQP